MASEESTTSLIERARAGDQTGWAALVVRYENLLWSVARGHRLSSADAGDVVQTTWVKLLENLDRVQDPERLAGWLATTARRECLAVLRKAGRELPDDDAVIDVADDAPPPESGLVTQERDAELWRCFSLLGERCQRLLRVLMATDRPNYEDVGAALGMPVGSIGPTRGRCLTKLREIARERGSLVEGLA